MHVEVSKALEGTSDLLSKINKIVDRQILKIHTTTIGIIKSFDATKQTATVLPAIKRVVVTEGTQTTSYDSEDYSLLVNVPVVFPGGGDWFMTFPVAIGDECLLISMERSIGTWKLNGGSQDPSKFKRKLSLQDAVAVVGIQSQASPLPTFNDSEPELRSRDGSVKLVMTKSGVTLMDSTDNAVRYSALETAFNELNNKYNKLITALNSWTPVPSDGGAVLKTLLTSASPLSSTADITTTKVNEVLLP